MNNNTKTIIVTGGTSGLGFQAVKSLLRHKEWFVVIAGKNERRNTEAVKRLSANSTNVTSLCMDLASLDSVNHFLNKVTAKLASGAFPPLHGILCCAGVLQTHGSKVSEDGIEMTFQVNHLSHFLLINKLLPHMKYPGKIVLVSCEAHNPKKRTGFPKPKVTTAQALSYPRLHGSKVNSVRQGKEAYADSKLSNIWTGYHLARLLRAKDIKPSQISCNIFDPGFMKTGLWRNCSSSRRYLHKNRLRLLNLLCESNVQSASKSGANLTRLFTNQQFDKVSGKYIVGTRLRKSSTDSYSVRKARRMWRGTAELLELDPTLPLLVKM